VGLVVVRRTEECRTGVLSMLSASFAVAGFIRRRIWV
jgi:hypothetical protein